MKRLWPRAAHRRSSEELEEIGALRGLLAAGGGHDAVLDHPVVRQGAAVRHALRRRPRHTLYPHIACPTLRLQRHLRKTEAGWW